MKTNTPAQSSARRALLPASLLAFALAALVPAWQSAHAQAESHPKLSPFGSSLRHVEGLAMEHRKDDAGAFIAFTEAAQNGYGPAQRKLGDIYGHGNTAVPRDYEESLNWYEKARARGEQIPPIQSRMPRLDAGPLIR